MARIQSFLFGGIVVGVGATILGARWSLIDRFGIDLPTWDEWDAQGLHTLLPWFRHQPLLPELLAPHNEHVVAITKLANLALTLANGLWDQRLEAVANAFLPAGIAFACLFWARSILRPFFVAALSWVLLAAWALPFAWHNAVAGFHSQQFFVIAFSFAAIAWVPYSAPNSLRWWLGSLGCVCAVFSMASGFFAAVIIFLLSAIRILQRNSTIRDNLPTLTLAATVSIVGWLMRHEVPYHETLKAQSLADFAGTALHALQWPATEHAWLAVILWLPTIFLSASLVFLRTDGAFADRNGWRLFGLAAWVGLNIAATAYARGAGAPAPSTRYLDTLAFGCVVNALALAWLDQVFLSRKLSILSSFARREGVILATRVTLVLLGLAWIATFSKGVLHDSERAMRDDLPALHDYQRQALARTRAYLETRNPAYLESKDIPYPGADSFLFRLNTSELFRLLPASTAPSLPLERSKATRGFNRTTQVADLPWNEQPDAGMILGLNKPSHTAGAPSHRAFWRSESDSGLLPEGVWRLPSTSPGWLVLAIRATAGTSLELREEGESAPFTQLQPSRLNEWTWVSLRAPSKPSVLTTSAPQGQSIAFTEPVFMPTLSYLAWRTSANGKYVQKFGLTVLSLSTLALCIVEWRRHLYLRRAPLPSALRR